MMEEGKTFMSELNDGTGATVATELVPLIKFLNRMNVKTVSSHVGDDGCFVTLGADTYHPLVEALFHQIQPMTTHLPDVQIEVFFSGGWIGIIRFTKAELDDISRRVGCWLEMLHK